jgi:hypothetical protein
MKAMSNIITTNGEGEENFFGEIENIANHFVQSGYFKDLRSVSQAVVKILKGRELGIGPFTAIDQINMIQGRPSPNANLIAALIRKSKDYDYEILEHTDQVCRLQILRHGKPSGPPVEFTYENAKKAGLTRNATYQAYPRNMLFARAISNAAKFGCPDVTTGLYVPEDFEGTPVIDIIESKKPSNDVTTLLRLSMETGTTLEDINITFDTTFTEWSSVCKDPEMLVQIMKFLNTKKETQ